MGGSDLTTATGRYFAGSEDTVVDDQKSSGGGEFRQVQPALADPAQRVAVAQSSLGDLSWTAGDSTDGGHVAGMNQDWGLDSPGRRDQFLQQAAGAADPRLKGLIDDGCRSGRGVVAWWLRFAEEAGRHQVVAHVFDGQMGVGVDRRGHRCVAEQLLHHLGLQSAA